MKLLEWRRYLETLSAMAAQLDRDVGMSNFNVARNTIRRNRRNNRRNDSFLCGWLPHRGKAQMACNLLYPHEDNIPNKFEFVY